MTFSYGNNFFDDLLNYSDKTTKDDDKSLKQTYELQQRLNNFWANNSLPTLLKSQKFSGETDITGKEKSPLGGSINPLRPGIRNAPGTPACSDEFDFWNLNDKKHHKKEENNQEDFEIVNNETNTETKENFTNQNIEYMSNISVPLYVWIIIILVVLLVLILVFFHYYKK